MGAGKRILGCNLQFIHTVCASYCTQYAVQTSCIVRKHLLTSLLPCLISLHGQAEPLQILVQIVGGERKSGKIILINFYPGGSALLEIYILKYFGKNQISFKAAKFVSNWMLNELLILTWNFRICFWQCTIYSHISTGSNCSPIKPGDRKALIEIFVDTFQH